MVIVICSSFVRAVRKTVAKVEQSRVLQKSFHGRVGLRRRVYLSLTDERFPIEIHREICCRNGEWEGNIVLDVWRQTSEIRLLIGNSILPGFDTCQFLAERTRKKRARVLSLVRAHRCPASDNRRRSNEFRVVVRCATTNEIHRKLAGDR